LGLVAMSSLPRLAPAVVVRKLSTREETYVIVKDTQSQKFFKFEVWEQDFMELLDGTREVDEIDAEFRKKHPELGTDSQWTLDYLEGLKELGLLERTDQERHLVMMDKVKTLRKRRFYDAEKSTLMQVTIPLFDPNRMMDRVMPWIRWWWSPWFIAAWMVVFVWILGYLVYYWDLYWTGFIQIWDVTEKGPWDWVGFIALLFGVSIWHELGHAFACKRYGGEVHDIGFMIFYLQPAFYCNVDDSYIFPKQSHRLAATFGGPYFELMMCSVAAAVWLTTPAEWWIHSLALTLVFFTGLSVILMNVNPLIKLDGYYILMDWLDVPELREESFEYMGNLFRQHLLGVEVPHKAISRRRRRIYLIYGVCALLYTAAVLYVLYFLLRKWLVVWLGPLGYLVLFGMVFYAYRRKLVEARRYLGHLWMEKAKFVRSRRGFVLIGIVLPTLAILLTVVTSSTRLEGSFVVEPARRAVIRAPASGIVRKVMTSEGRSVSPAIVLAILQSPDLSAALDVAHADLARNLSEAVGARNAEDVSTSQEKSEAAREARSRLELLDGRLAGLTLRSPLDGVVSTPYLEEKEGTYLQEGEVFCTVDRLDQVRLAVATAENDIEEIRKGVWVRMLLRAYPERPLRARVLSLSPVAVPAQVTEASSLDLVRPANLVRVIVEIDNPSGLLRSGMTGRVQFLTKPRSVIGKLWWRLSRWGGSLFW
jgi:putative peptide zinc metalloprotease protein